MQPALTLIEFDSIAAGVQAGDAMAKKAPVAQVISGTVHNGKYLVLVSGEIADVEEAYAEGLAVGAGAILDSVFLPGVHPHVAAAVAVQRRPEPLDALGIIETRTVAAAIAAADAGVKGAEVNLIEVRLADGLGGKGLVFFAGLLHDVEEAVRVGVEYISASPTLVRAVVIPQLHPDMAANILGDTRWRANLSASTP